MSVERAIDRALEEWVRKRSGSEVLARAAFAVSRDEGLGHVCSSLSDDSFAVAELAVLRAHTWVGNGSRFTPFVLDQQANFYTWRNWRHEARVAEALLARAHARELPLAPADAATAVDELFPGADAPATHWQRVAVAAAPGSRIFVLTGGPGTGKTNTVLRILLMLLRHALVCGLPEIPAIALAAPTGKAAQRLGEAIGDGKQRLRAQLRADSVFGVLLERMPDAPPQTLHRLLGFRPRDNSFEHSLQKPLAADIVVVDEVSMIDIAMMRRLLDALRPEAMLILLGDPGQLHAIEAGSVLSDIAGSVGENALSAAVAETLNRRGRDTSAPLAGQVITLTHVWRAGVELQAGLDTLRHGDGATFETFCTKGDAALQLRVCPDAATLRKHLQSWLDAHDCYAQITQTGVEPERALRSLREAQILCALREGAFGAAGINALVTRLLAERVGFDLKHDWFHGRPIIITRNDYTRELYNGDIGIALQSADGLRVWFATSAGLRSFSPRTLPAHETAWAITIHRSQGSEYRDVAVVLPPDAESRILSRELLYTAVSRATTSAEIWTSAAALRTAAGRSIQRRGGLRTRLAALS